MDNKPKSLRFYRANKNNTGSVAEFQLSYKEAEKYDKWLVFLKMAKQTGTDEKGNASYSWDSGITVKLDPVDIGEILTVLTGRKESSGYNGSLYHETPTGGTKIIKFNYTDKGYNLSISAQDKEKNPAVNMFINISEGEACILTELLKAAVVKIYGWQ